MPQTPVYFIGHGGPNLNDDNGHPVYPQLQKIGKEITSLNPDGVVVVSAHWQSHGRKVEVNIADKTDLIYDFYGFPSHLYKEKFPHRGSPDLAKRVLKMLNEAGIEAKGVTRGLDHGVWVPFKCAFPPESNLLDVPIVQMSFPDTEDPEDHFRLGQAISGLRDQNVVIILTGMAVHNLRDLRFSFTSSKPLPYAVSFDEALRAAVEHDPSGREQSLAALLQRPDARKAHPTFEHLLPLYVGAGAAKEDRGKRLWTLPEGSMSWAQFRFGEIPSN